MEQIVSTTPEFFRIEGSIISRKNLTKLFNITNDYVAESILHYIYVMKNYNSCKDGFLDPEDFGKTFKFSRQYLQEKVENPYQKAIVPSTANIERKDLRYRIPTQPETDMIYENRIENALFILQNFPFPITYTATDKNNRSVTTTIKTRHILESFSVLQDIKTGKVTYRYHLNNDFISFVHYTYEIYAKIDSIINLRKTNLGPLYFFLLEINVKCRTSNTNTTATTPSATPTLNYLCELAGINQNQELKYQKRDLKNAFRKIWQKTEIHAKLTWYKDNNNNTYIPIITFEE